MASARLIIPLEPRHYCRQVWRKRPFPVTDRKLETGELISSCSALIVITRTKLLRPSQDSVGNMNWESITSAKIAILLSLIPSHLILDLMQVPPASNLRDFGGYVPRFLGRRELEFTNASCDAILTNIRSGDWTAEEVTRAFCHRAAIAHQLVRN